MGKPETQKELEDARRLRDELLHAPDNAALEKLEAVYHHRTTGMYLRDVVFGANDGIVTTFAVVSGVAGAALAPDVVIILGLANLLADGISMGAGAYLGEKSEHNYNRTQRIKEEWEIENVRPIEVQEVRDVFLRYGFTGTDLERATEIIINNKKTWVDFMMREELGIIEGEGAAPAKHGIAIFIAFAIAGTLPLLPYLIPLGSWEIHRFLFSIVLSAVTLFTIGASRSKFSPESWLISGLEMLGVGALAAVSAYGIGVIIGKFV